MYPMLWRFHSLARQIARVPSKRTDLQRNSINRIVKNSSVYANPIFTPIPRYNAQSSGSAFRSHGYRLLNTPLVRFYTTENNTSESGKLLKLASDLFEKGNLHEAYELVEKSFALATPDEALFPLNLKTRVAKIIGRDGWQHEFFSDLKKFDPESNLFRTAFNEAMSLVAGKNLSSLDSTEVSEFFNAALTAFPNNYQVVLGHGKLLTVQNNFNEAVFYLKKAANINPNKSEAWRTLWMITEEDDALKKAIACPNAYKDEVLLVRYGQHLIEKENNVTEGIKYIQQGLNVNSAYKYDGTYDNMLEKLVQMLVSERNDSVSAKKLLQIWLNVHPTNLIAWNNLGAIHWQENNLEDAKKCFEKITEIAPNLAIGWFYLALLQPAADRVPKLLKAIELDPTLVDAHFELAQTYLALNQPDPALKSIDRVIELDESLAPAYRLKATIYARMKRYQDEFLAAYRYYELISSEGPAFAYFVYAADQRFEEGLAFVRQHIQNESPKISLFRYTEAMLLEAMERYDEALKAIDIAIQTAQKNGDRMELMIAMGAKATWLLKTGNITEARHVADMLRQQQGTGLSIFALFDRHEGKFDEAIAKMKQLVDPGIEELNVHRYIGLLDIAETLEAKGDLTAAAEQYKLVLEINPKYKRAQKRLQAVLLKLAKQALD